jgi:hypothetical protein
MPTHEQQAKRLKSVQRSRTKTRDASNAGAHSLDSSIANSAVRSAIRSTRMLSFTACAPSPTPPNPSRVGMPRAAVKLPSDPPPDNDSSSLTPSSWAMPRAVRNSFLMAGVRSMGGRFKPPSTCIEQRLSNGRNARNFLSNAGASLIRTTLMSISARASAAMTLLRVPPDMTPGFTVMPCSKQVNPAIRWIWRAGANFLRSPEF